MPEAQALRYDGPMAGRVLHVLSQRPSLTGSGVTLDALVRLAGQAGWEQRVVCGVPADDPAPAVGGLPPGQVLPLVFGGRDLPFPVPGMSDVMPYPSTRFSALTAAQLAAYRAAWSRHLGAVVAAFSPDVVHAHHVWLVSALLKDVAPGLPVVTHCHATGLRQRALCPGLAGPVRNGVRRNERFVVLTDEHARTLREVLDVGPERIVRVGAGYREDVFHARGRPPAPAGSVLYAGKLSRAKGLPWLLDAVERLDAVLHVAGSGAGPESESLASRMAALAPRVVSHGQVDQRRLAELMRACSVFVLPSFYEGLPLVLVEALACGCRLVATRLPGTAGELSPHLGAALDLVDPPGLRGSDEPVPADLPGFVDRLEAALAAALARPPLGGEASGIAQELQPFTWGSVFGRVEAVWREAISLRRSRS